MKRKTKAKPKNRMTMADLSRAVGQLAASVRGLRDDVSSAAIDAKVQAAAQRVIVRAGTLLDETRQLQQAALQSAPVREMSEIVKSDLADLDKKLDVDEAELAPPCASARWSTVSAMRSAQRAREIEREPK